MKGKGIYLKLSMDKNCKYLSGIHEKPAISVLMPVYNGEKWLNVAVRSILAQTYTNFELLILLEYGSSVESKKIVYGYKDKRIRIIENKKKIGLAASLNKGINEAKGKYIARMDADDISIRNRLEEQIVYLEKHPDIAICGTAVWWHRIMIRRKPANAEAVRFASFNENVFAHPTVMWRKKLFLQKNLFYQEGVEAEDFELWTRVLDYYKGVNISKPLLIYRSSEESKSFVNKNIIEVENDKILKPYWARNGMRYYPENKCYRNLKFQNEKLWQQEWRLIELTNKTKDFRGKKHLVKKRFFDFYTLETLQINRMVNRYFELFQNLYVWPKWTKIQLFCYAVFRVTSIKFRALIIRGLKCLTKKGI